MRLSRTFDRLLPAEYTVDGNRDFKDRFALEWIMPHTKVVDIGGGKNPFIAPELKHELAIHVTGVDISAQELANAPPGAYDATRCGDITNMTGSGDVDVCICQAVLEHVEDVEAAVASLASFLRPGGVALIFVPSRNAVFAKLNLALPEGVKRLLLFTIFPHTKRGQGFRSYYDRCTPVELRESARAAGLEIQEEKYYFSSAYFTFCVPLHILWRFWLVLFRSVAGENAAETFSLALRKTGEAKP